MKNLFDLRGERILITGAGGSIGGATARVCKALGAELFIADLTSPNELGVELKARAATLDNTKREDVNALIRDIGHIDALIDTSGCYVKGDWIDGGDDWEELSARHMAIISAKQPFALESYPMKRFGQLEEIGWPAAFLASRGASFTTGAVLDVNGGMCFS